MLVFLGGGGGVGGRPPPPPPPPPKHTNILKHILYLQRFCLRGVLRVQRFFTRWIHCGNRPILPQCAQWRKDRR